MRKQTSLIVGALLIGLCPGLLYAQTSARGTYTVTEDVPLRAGPGTNHPIITTLPKGIKIHVVGREGYWLRVESKHGDKPGYIDDRFARLDTPSAGAAASKSTPPAAAVAGAYRTLRDVELREGPGTKYKSVALLPAGIKVHVVRAEGDWLRVESKKGGKPGYLEKRSVERWTDR
ncbi:MAG TPA: SH3 domain-containing protein [Candidatus Binatia bacterium]|jgi:mannosyl-glycoprotein endo-beta-N-acetylglucosaminidase|nr:SH3 domain-containing protein [Candidatus Binatia bacterium]